MRTFILKVVTRTDFDNADHFASALEDLVPWFYNEKAQTSIESTFKKVTVLQLNEIHALGEQKAQKSQLGPARG